MYIKNVLNTVRSRRLLSTWIERIKNLDRELRTSLSRCLVDYFRTKHLSNEKTVYCIKLIDYTYRDSLYKLS